MRFILFLFSTFLLMACGTETAPKLKGTWSLVSGQETDPERSIGPGEVEFTFGEEDSLTLVATQKGEKRTKPAFFRVNTGQKPWTMDIRTPEGAQVYGIWEITPEGQLHIEHNLSERPRPGTFWKRNAFIYYLVQKP